MEDPTIQPRSDSREFRSPGPESLDADAILAGMAATVGRPGDSVVVATTNVRHLARSPGIDAREWGTVV